MHTADYMIGPGGPVPEDVADANVLTGTIDGEPVVMLLARFRITQIAASGALISGDALESAVRTWGAVPLNDLAFDRAPVHGWRAVIEGRSSELRLITPDGEQLYNGSLVCEPAWYRQVAERQRDGRGLVVIIGAAAPTEAAALEMIAAGRASWVRARIELVD